MANHANITPNESHIRSLVKNGVCIKAPDGTMEPVTMEFYHRAVEQCRKGDFNAVTFELVIPGINGEFMMAVWQDGHVDSGSAHRVMDCLDR